MIDKPATHEAENTFNATVDVREVRAPQQPGMFGARLALFVSILALFFTAAGVAAGYKHWKRMDDKLKDSSEQIGQIKQQLAAAPLASSLDDLRKELDAKTKQNQDANTQAVQEVARMQNQTRQFAGTVADQVEQITLLQARMQQSATPTNAADWRVAEVEFLLQLANRELHLSHDIGAASSALKEADALLVKLAAVNYLPVRQQITRDLASLDSFKAPDIAGISQRINALMLSLKPLPAVSVPHDPATETAAKGQAGAGSWWESAQHKFNEAVVIRQFDKPISTELDADARQHLYQLLQLRLENLRLLALQGQDAAFHAQLDLLGTTVRTYYPESEAKTLLASLDEFKAVNLQPVYPDISGSFKQLESARQVGTTETPNPSAPRSPAVGKGGKKP